MSKESTSIKSSQRITINIPEVYKNNNNEEVWEELEKYVYTGFLSSQAVVSGHNFVFKTLNHLELKQIDFMRPMRTAPAEARGLFRSHFIAHSVFMIDGNNVLFERPKNINRLVRIISRLQPAVQEKIIENLTSLNSRAHRLYPLTEVYVHESRSRYRWLQMVNMPIHSAMQTGISGTENMGMNYAQQTWVALNRVHDKREEIESNWSNAKFIGSCMSKGVRSIDERDRSRAEKERTDLEDKKMRVLYGYLNRTEMDAEPPQTVQLPDGRQAVVEKRFRADSVQELADQLSSALSGEKDHHDIVMEEKIRSLGQRTRMIEEQQRRMYSSSSEPLGEFISSGPSRVLGGKSEADAYLSRINELRAKQIEEVRNFNPDLNQTSDEIPE